MDKYRRVMFVTLKHNFPCEVSSLLLTRGFPLSHPPWSLLKMKDAKVTKERKKTHKKRKSKVSISGFETPSLMIWGVTPLNSYQAWLIYLKKERTGCLGVIL